ncbi:MAG: hypothetical protein IJB67_01745 [Firmicutes bacterium]|nr:hypothetical protein [Bacillota bacterium]
MWLENQMLVINGIELPAVSRDRYSAPLVALESSKEAIDGTVIREHRGWRRQINYEIDYLGNEKTRQLLAALRSGRELVVQFLPDDDDYPQTMSFFCTRYPQPRAAFAKGGVLLWHNISFTLESVKVVNA